MDARRRPWFALSVDFAATTTGTRLQDELGPAALAVWVALLAAAKRSSIEGTFIWGSEPEAWQLLYIHEPDRLGFTFDEFLKLTGRLKQTRRHDRARVHYVAITHWADWQHTRQRRTRRTRNAPGTPGGDTTDTDTTPAKALVRGPQSAQDTLPIGDTDRDKDRDTDKDKDTKRPMRPRDELWDALVVEFGEPTTKTARGMYNRARKELEDADATAGDVRTRAREYRRRWPDVADTPTALVKHWHTMAVPEPKDAYEQRMVDLARAAEEAKDDR